MKIGLAILLSFLLNTFILFPGRAIAQTTMPLRGLCAHRGAMNEYPENTLPAFLEAIYEGAQMIEFDLQMTKDSVLVIMHDRTVDRTTNGKGAVADLTLAEVSQLDAGSKKGTRFRGVNVPTFEEVLAIMPHNIWLNCHLKGGELAARIATKIIVKQERLNQAFLACNKAAAQAARAVDSHILICNMDGQFGDIRKYVQSTIKMKANFIQFIAAKGMPDQDLINSLKQHNIFINYFQLEDPKELQQSFKAGIDFPLTSNISKFIPFAQKLGIDPVRPEF